MILWVKWTFGKLVLHITEAEDQVLACTVIWPYCGHITWGCRLEVGFWYECIMRLCFGYTWGSFQDILTLKTFWRKENTILKRHFWRKHKANTNFFTKIVPACTGPKTTRTVEEDVEVNESAAGGLCLLTTGTSTDVTFKLRDGFLWNFQQWLMHAPQTALLRIPPSPNDLLTSVLPLKIHAGAGKKDSLWVATSSVICHHFLAVMSR